MRTGGTPSWFWPSQRECQRQPGRRMIIPPSWSWLQDLLVHEAAPDPSGRLNSPRFGLPWHPMLFLHSQCTVSSLDSQEGNLSLYPTHFVRAVLGSGQMLSERVNE